MQFLILWVFLFLTVLITISLIWLYTYRSGMKTIIWTDTLQTTFMLSTVFIIGYTLMDKMNLDISALFSTINDSTYSKVFFFDDMADKKYFFKQFFFGVFMAIVMTGLDQDQMQKNLSCRNLKDAQKNMTVFSVILIFVDLLFLCLGALLYINYYSMPEVNQVLNLPEQADMLFPHIAISSGLPAYVGILFIIGIIAAAYSSADSALTSLTTSFCVDIIEFEKQDAEKQIKTRKYTHLIMSLVLFSVIMIFHAINDQSVVKSLFTVAGYTYGPLLGLFSFGLFTKFQVKDKYVPFICLASPVICYFFKFIYFFWI